MATKEAILKLGEMDAEFAQVPCRFCLRWSLLTLK